MTGPREFLLIVLAAVVVVTVGCGQRQSRRDVYYHVMTPLEQANYSLLEARRKPVSLRLAYLQGIGVYQKWAEQPNNIQEAVLRREILEGMTPLQVRMAWGSPDGRRDVTTPAERAEGHALTVWDYGLNTSADGGDYERSVCFLDDRVLWVRLSK